MGERGSGEGNREGRIVRVELPKVKKYEGVVQATNFGMEYSEEEADTSTVADNAIPIKITIGEHTFTGISPSSDKEPIDLKNCDVELIFSEGWAQRVDLHTKGYQLIGFTTGPMGKPRTHFYHAYVKKELIPILESIFTEKQKRELVR
jgi:hypothetical protein